MCNLLDLGVLYTEYERIKANTPVASPWSYEMQASDLVDQLVPLDELWPRNEVERLCGSLLHLDTRRRATRLRDELITRIGREASHDVVAGAAARLIPRRWPGQR